MATPGRLARIVAVAVGGALGVVTIGLGLALWALGLTGKVSQHTSDVLDLVKLGFALVAGVGGTVGLVLAYQRHLIAVSAESREDSKLFGERFGKAAEQMASESYAVQLAGVYAMAKLADDWDEGRQTCINVLCANLRRGWDPDPGPDGEPAARRAFADNQELRHTIIAVITTRLRNPDSPWQGHNFDFHGTVFDGGDFGGATFAGGTVNFTGATFSGGEVYFGGATFSGGEVNFIFAAFAGGEVSFGGTTFAGGDVIFGSATFTGGKVNFIYATFTGGEVNFAPVVDWSVPPVFGFAVDAVPAGVVLPRGAASGSGVSPVVPGP